MQGTSRLLLDPLPARAATVCRRASQHPEKRTTTQFAFANIRQASPPAFAMSTFTSFAIVGVGRVGRVVVGDLLKKGLRVTILTRDDTKGDLQDFKNRGALLAKVDYKDQESLTKALRGVEAVVSTVGPFRLGSQIDVIRAAKAAGVQYFVPAKFGVDLAEGLARGKKVVQDLLKQLELPYTLFFCGLFYEVVAMRLGHSYAEGKIQVAGDGKTQFSLTARDDVGKFVAHVLSTVSKEELQWVKIPFEGDRLSPLEIIAISEKKFGKKMNIVFVDANELRAKSETDFGAFMLTLLADGHGVAGSKDDISKAKAKLFSEWNPTPYEALMA